MMMRRLLAIVVSLFVAPMMAAAQTSSASAVRRVPNPDRAGTALTVRSEDAPLIFTEQVFAADTTRDAAAQTAQMLDELDRVIAAAGGAPGQLLRLNLYVADDSVTPAVDAVVAQRFAAAPPAVTLVRSPLAKPGALIAGDAIAVSARTAKAVALTPGAAVMPAGGKIFVSGQAKRGSDLRASVAQTMAALHASVAHLGRAKADVVQVKAFIAPFVEHAVAREEIARSFDGGSVPPIVLLEWFTDSPTEIELVVAAPELAATAADRVAFLPLPGLSPSPVFSRVTTVAAGTPLIFIAGLDGGDAGDARAQWRRVFADLAGALLESGSSFRHLVKATYFLRDPQARAALGEIRGVYYDPARPPAASALDVTSLGRPGRRVALDLIAVPAKVEAPK